MKCLSYTTWIIFMGVFSPCEAFPQVSKLQLRDVDARAIQLGPIKEALPQHAFPQVSKLQLRDVDVGAIQSGPIKEALPQHAFADLTTAEKAVGRSIASKLDNLLTPTSSFKSMSISGAELESGSLRPSQYMDLMLVLDSSGSIGKDEFNTGKEATEVIVDYIHNKSQISSTGSRVGLIRFSSRSRVVFRFGDYNSRWAVTNAINNVNYVGGMTATALALTSAKTEFNTNGHSHHAKVVWILTDGKSNTGGKPTIPASQLKNMGVTICAVAIGGDINMAELNSIAPGCVFKLNTFSKYKRVMEFASQSGGSLKPDLFNGMQFRK